jgi:hypothetical protein
MGTYRSFIMFIFLAAIGCERPLETVPSGTDSIKGNENHLQPGMQSNKYGTGVLLLTRFKSLEEFKQVVKIQYAEDFSESTGEKTGKPLVLLTYRTGTREVTSILKSGISQADFLNARKGTVWDRALLGLKCPFAFRHRKDLMVVENLGRRRPFAFGKGDVAFYDLAETMVKHISDEDTISMSGADLSEKGYLNTFNHITAQAFMTSIYSERLADFVADVHELYNMPELITGHFTEEQLADFENGPVDNYLDMINNELGQELGKELGKKYNINRLTYWTPALLTDYLNDIQSYHSWAFQIGFKPFKVTDELVIRFAGKINMIKGDL